jgi:integrase
VDRIPGRAGAREPGPEDRRRQVSAQLRRAHRLSAVQCRCRGPRAAVKNILAERILEENDVIRLIALEPDPRNHALLRLGYIAGLRISEICGLRWRDAQRRAAGTGQIAVFGKGGKTRVIVLPASIWRELLELRGEAPDDDPAFRSAKGGALDPSQVHRIVKRAAARAGPSRSVSAHYLRHAHVSHALDRGAPAHLVQATVGHSDLRTTVAVCAR